jgi:hypothetical protein
MSCAGKIEYRFLNAQRQFLCFAPNNDQNAKSGLASFASMRIAA